MLELFEAIKDVPEPAREALYELAAQQLAAQTLTVAFATNATVERRHVQGLFEKITMDPSVLIQKISLGSSTTVGDRAADAFLRLARMRQGFVVGI